MKEFSIGEIIAHSQRIEQESYAFYSRAAEVVADDRVRTLLRELASEEIRHYNLLASLIDQPGVDAATLSARVKIETDLYNRFIKTHEIGPESGRREVLEIALERENNTEALYAMLLTFTDLSDPIVSVFDKLRLQELGHASRIRALME